MKQSAPSNKVISLKKKIVSRKSTGGKNSPGSTRPNTRVISITSGKGGVGKTNIVANLGFALCQMGKRVLILDADLGLANIDVLLGLAPKYNFSHVFMGQKRLNEITVEGPGKLQILPASSGIMELTKLTKEQGIRFLKDLDELLYEFDILLIDTAAGISSNVMYFNTSAQEIVVVVSPEPTSITDAYALMKVLSLKYNQKKFKLIVNIAADRNEADEVFRQLSLVADRFLDISIEYLGYISLDDHIKKSVRRQKIVSEIYPNCEASQCFMSLAEKICNSSGFETEQSGSNFVWKYLLGTEFE